ncbi:MAG: transcriptional regulator [Gammaproteobacteria bacterium]|nr:transcriptional regulator [Gammaproteobacteria bacterium]
MKPENVSSGTGSLVAEQLVELPRAAANEADPGRNERLRSMAVRGWRTLLFYAAVAAVLAAGWQRRGDVYLSPEQGAGYALGIAGAIMMLLLLLYPLRKHAGWMRRLGRVRHWFRMHMLMGIIGPVCILYHCNFQLGSMNGNVALFSMLLVASSGLVGRYFYTRVHYGLYGRKADLAHLGSDAVALRKSMQVVFDVMPALSENLVRLERQTLQLPHGLIGSLVHVLATWVKSRWCGLVAGIRLRRALGILKRQGGIDNRQLHSLRQSSRFYLRSYLETIRRVAGFTFYERLFALWHVLHLPLFVMLLLSGVIHVYAVHMY